MIAIIDYCGLVVKRVNSERHVYYYSVICDEIERRDEKECPHK